MTLHNLDQSSKIEDSKIRICRWCYEPIEENRLVSSCIALFSATANISWQMYFHAGTCSMYHRRTFHHQRHCNTPAAFAATRQDEDAANRYAEELLRQDIATVLQQYARSPDV